MREFERVPLISKEAGFPVVDISYEQKRKSDEWLQKLEEMDADTRRHHIGEVASVYANGPVSLTEIRTLNAAEGVCNIWDLRDGRQLKLARAGFAFSQALINETGILPSCDIDMADWFNGLMNDEKGYKFDHQQFTHMTLTNMLRSHPKVFDVYSDMLGKARDWYSINADMEAQFQAGFALSYMLSSTSVMLSQMRNTRFTSMSNEQHDLSTTELEQMFSNEKQISTVALIKEWMMRNEKTRELQTKVGPVLGAAAVRVQESDIFKSIAAKPVTQAFVSYWRSQKRK